MKNTSAILTTKNAGNANALIPPDAEKPAPREPFDPKGAHKTYDPCAWGLFRGDFVSAKAVGDRVYITVRRGGATANSARRLSVALPLEGVLKLLNLARTEARKVALGTQEQRPEARDPQSHCGDCGEANGRHTPECRTANYIQ